MTYVKPISALLTANTHSAIFLPHMCNGRLGHTHPHFSCCASLMNMPIHFHSCTLPTACVGCNALMLLVPRCPPRQAGGGSCMSWEAWACSTVG